MKCLYVSSLASAIALSTIAGATQAATIQQVEGQLRGINDRLSAMENRFRVNGFASFGITQSDEEFKYNDINNETNYRRNTKAGIQMSFNLDSQTSVVTQLVARGTDSFETNMEWAYFKHQITPNLSTKIGRFRAPYYMLSEYLDVGYAVPWATMPQETYDSLNVFSNMDGIDLTYSMEIGDLVGTTQFAYGRVDTDSIVLDDLFSIGFTLAGDTWQTRLAYSQANTISEFGGVALYGDDTSVVGSFASLGATYDPGDLYVAAETTILEVDGSITDATSSYGTVGYRFGEWLPHLTYAVTESTDDEDRDLSKVTDPTNPVILGQAAVYSASFNRNTQRIGIGARWDYTSGVAIKFQYDMITTDDAPGLFGSSTTDATEYVTAAAAGDEPDSTNIVSITIDTVF